VINVFLDMSQNRDRNKETSTKLRWYRHAIAHYVVIESLGCDVYSQIHNIDRGGEGGF